MSTQTIVRKNTYAARCTSCGNQVPAGEGALTNVNGKWLVNHLPECPQPAIVIVVPETPSFAVPEGTYTVSFEDGSYRTLRVRLQSKDKAFMPGVVLLSYLSGSDNENSYTSFAHAQPNGRVKIWNKFRDNASLATAVDVLLGDPKAAALGYAERSGCCYRCGRTLTTPESIARGMGPECAGKGGF